MSQPVCRIASSLDLRSWCSVGVDINTCASLPHLPLVSTTKGHSLVPGHLRCLFCSRLCGAVGALTQSLENADATTETPTKRDRDEREEGGGETERDEESQRETERDSRYVGQLGTVGWMNTRRHALQTSFTRFGVRSSLLQSDVLCDEAKWKTHLVERRSTCVKS